MTSLSPVPDFNDDLETHMVNFQLETGPVTRALLSIASAHGFADVCLKPRWRLLVYSSCLLPVPGHVATAFFFSLSAVHFAVDVGLSISLAAHFMLMLLASKRDFYERAFVLAIAYTALVHTPLFYMRLFREGEYTSLSWAVLGTCFFMCTDVLFIEDKFTLSHRRQIVAACHIIARI